MAADRPSLTGEANIGLRTSNERPDGPPLAADASVVTAVANMAKAAARFARAGPQERSEHFRTPHSPASAKPLSLHTFPCRTHAFTYCSLAARLLYAGESTQLMAGRRQGHRGPLPRRPRGCRDGGDTVVRHLFTAGRHPHRPAPVSRGKWTLFGLGCHGPCDLGQYEPRVHACREGACARVVPFASVRAAKRAPVVVRGAVVEPNTLHGATHDVVGFWRS